MVLNEGINFAIKHIVQEPSPATGDFVRGRGLPLLCEFAPEGGAWIAAKRFPCRPVARQEVLDATEIYQETKSTKLFMTNMR